MYIQRLGINDDHTDMSYMRLAVVICWFKSEIGIESYSVFTSLINLFQWQNRYYLSIKFGYWYIWYIIKTKHIFSISSQIWSSVQWTTLMFLAHALSMYVYCYSKCGVVLPLIVLLWAAIASLLTFSIYLPFVSTIDLLILWLSD